MNYLRYAPVFVLLLLLVAPFILGGNDAQIDADAPQVIIVSPHNEQIRSEFSRAYASWHLEKYGTPARVTWSTPGGTSEIRKLLISEYTAALRQGLPPGGNADIVWGGGSYEFGVMSKPITMEIDGETRSTTILAPLDLDSAFLSKIYGDGRIANEPLFNKDGYWFGTALSSFGIVYNRDVLELLKLPEPVGYESLTVPGYRNAMTLVNPGMSGSVTTAFEALVERRGWTRGWQILRRMSANARAFAGSSTKGPLDVAEGSAAAAVCIDFYGRYEAQRTRAAAIASGADPDSPGRIGYVDPPGETMIDPDPIAMLRGAPHPERARRFIEFVLSVQGQALWQFPVTDEGLGPHEFELRRLPIRRSMYTDHFNRFIDKVNPWDIAKPVENPNRAVRSFITPIFQAMALDQPFEIVDAWNAIVGHPGFPADARDVITAADVEDPQLKRMLEAFDAMPEVIGPEGVVYDLADPSVLGTVKSGWFKAGWKDADLWPPEADPVQAFRRDAREFFRSQYREVVRISEESTG